MEQGHMHRCKCSECKRFNSPTKVIHAQMNVLLSTLDERQRRLYAGLESKKMGHGGDRRLALITGLSVNTIAKGRRELEQDHSDNRIRSPGGGRPAVEKKRPRHSARSRTTTPRIHGGRPVQ